MSDFLSRIWIFDHSLRTFQFAIEIGKGGLEIRLKVCFLYCTKICQQKFIQYYKSMNRGRNLWFTIRGFSFAFPWFMGPVNQLRSYITIILQISQNILPTFLFTREMKILLLRTFSNWLRSIKNLFSILYVRENQIKRETFLGNQIVNPS